LRKSTVRLGFNNDKKARNTSETNKENHRTRYKKY
jgi:hypothetical protein